VCADARVIQEMSTKHDVLGITAVDDELFVLQDRKALFAMFNKPVAVYSVNSYLKLRRLKVPGFKPGRNSDITSCVRHKCLYMSDELYIRRYELANSAVSKWHVGGQPCGLSVTPGCNLLVIHKKRDMYFDNSSSDDDDSLSSDDDDDDELDMTYHLVELSADSGRLLRKISLPSDIDTLSHSVQLTNRQFVVCHDLCQVSLFSDGGKVTYGGGEDSDVRQLNTPSHLAVDKKSQFVFVADKKNHRVVLVSPRLEFVRDVIEWLSCPSRLFFDQATRRLFVGNEYGGKITVIKL